MAGGGGKETPILGGAFPNGFGPSAPTEPIVVDHQRLSLIIAFNIFQTTGLVLTIVILFTSLFSSRIQRLGTYYTLLISILFYDLSMLVLALAQIQTERRAPMAGICLFQGVLVDAGLVWMTGALASYVIHVYHTANVEAGGTTRARRWKFWLIAVPQALGVLALIVDLGTTLQIKNKHNMKEFRVNVAKADPGLVCMVINSSAQIFSTTMAAVALLLGAIFAVCLGRILFSKRTWIRTGSISDAGSSIQENEERANRRTLFQSSSMIAALVALVVVLYMQPTSQQDRQLPLRKSNIAKALVISIVPVLISICLLCERELFDVWMFWTQKKYRKSLEVPVTPTNQVYVSYPASTPARSNFVTTPIVASYPSRYT